MSKTSYTSIDEVMELPVLQAVSTGMGGKYIAYVRRTPDWAENEFRNHVWIYEAERRGHYPITTGKSESSSPRWSPDSARLAYIAKVGEDKDRHDQIFLKSFDEFNGLQLTYSKEGVHSFLWAPDGKGIFYTTIESESEELKKRRELYGDFRYIDRENKNKYLCYIGLEEAIERAKNEARKKSDKEDSRDIARILTSPKDFNVRGFDISGDGKRAALVCTPTGDIRDNNTSIRILDIETGESHTLNVKGIIASDIAFSPEGKRIVFSRTPREPEYYKWQVEEDIIPEIYDVERDETIIRLPELYSGMTPLSWTNKGILSIWQDRTNMRIGMVSEEGEVNLINRDMSYIISASITPEGKNLAYIKLAENKAAEIYLDGCQITDESRVYENKLLSIKEVVRWNTRDGLEIEGVLSKPQDYDPDKRYPLLVVVHGGPTWASFPFHNMNKIYPIEQFVEKGYIILEPNYRGSSGYGSKFMTSNYRMLGVGDYEDVISGVDMLIEKGIADGERVGIMGWSQGGYISAFCSTFSSRFKAISVGAGISNWVTYNVNTDITSFTWSYLGATPWDDPEIYAKTSPMTYINSACTPTLIQHGDGDKRVPVPNAFELYRGLRDKGVESELVIFKGMPHGPNKPGFNKAAMEQNFDWFVKRV